MRLLLLYKRDEKLRKRLALHAWRLRGNCVHSAAHLNIQVQLFLVELDLFMCDCDSLVC